MGGQYDRDKDYQQHMHVPHTQQDRDWSTGDKHRGGTGKAGSKQPNPEATPTASAYGEDVRTDQSCVIGPPTPPRPVPRVQCLKAREAAAQHAAQQLLADEDAEVAKVAAKKAKKSRQNLKKQHAKGSQPSMEAADATRQEAPMQDVSTAQQGMQNSAMLNPLRQASAGEVQGAESALTQLSPEPGSVFANLFAEEIEHQVTPACALSPPLSVLQSRTAQNPNCTGLTGGSPWGIHNLLCCPLTEVNFERYAQACTFSIIKSCQAI